MSILVRLRQFLRDRFGYPSHDRNPPTHNVIDKIEGAHETVHQANGVVPYDENLLERARTQWQFGDWESLANIERETLQHHPDRARLALLVAAGHLQTDNVSVARQYIRLAQDWGCSKKMVTQILVAGVHNSLGRAAIIGGQQPRALLHFESAIAVGAPTSDTRLLTQARVGEQMAQLRSGSGVSYEALDKNGGASNLAHVKADIKVPQAENPFIPLLKKEQQRLQNIMENILLIAGLKQPLQQKIFCIGSNKTGTTSLDSAMRTLGFCAMPEDLANKYVAEGKDQHVQAQMFRQLMEKEADQYSFFEDLPFGYGDNYQLIDEFYPDAKYILTVRDPDAWFSSCLRWIERLENKAIYSWIWGIPFTKENKDRIISLYNKRNADIQNHFGADRPGRLFVLRIEQATFADLCSFLNLESSMVTSLIFPRDNVNDSTQ